MKSFLKYLGPILQLIGVILLAIYYVQSPSANTFLSAAGILVVAGIIVHIFVNKRVD